MSDRGDKLEAAYRALPREEPSAAIDAAILAASRRALARPSGARRWAAPVSIAAVLVLAFGVTLRMREEKPGIESPDVHSAPAVAPPGPAAPAPRIAERVPESAAPNASAPLARVPAKKAMPAAKPDEARQSGSLQRAEGDRAFRDELAPQPERKDMAAQAAPASEPSLQKESNVAGAPATTAGSIAAPPAAAARMKREAMQAPADAAADAQVAIDEPTRELEAIAKLRAGGRHEEADKALAEFRRKRPDYRIAEAMWERVKAR